MNPNLFLFLGGIRYLRPSLTLPLTTRGLSTTLASQASPPNPHFPVVDYLVQSCGLSSDDALQASKKMQHLKSPDKPDSVLLFLREMGVSESDIRTAVLKRPRILCSSVEKNIRPNIAKLQELGFSIEYISAFIARRPRLFQFNFAPKLDFWMQALGSTEYLSAVLKCNLSQLCNSLEDVLIPNVSFLKQECGLSPPEIVRLINSNARLITNRPEVLIRQVERATEQLGIARSSKAFVYALLVCVNYGETAVDARLKNFKNLGFSQEEVALLIRKHPLLLNASEEAIARKFQFLTKEAGCDRADVLQNPLILSLSLENRLIPRTTVWILLTSKGLPVRKLKFATFMKTTEEMFLKRFILPYEQDIPGLYQAYADAGKIKEID